MNVPEIFIFNKQEIFQCVLTTVTPNGCPFWDDELEISVDYGASYYNFTCPGDHPLSSKIEEEGLCAIKDQDDEYLLFRIKDIENVIDSNGNKFLRVFCESDALDLLSTPIRPITLTGYTLSQALNQILSGTGWEAGYIEFLGVRTFSIEKHMTALKAVHELRSVYDCEIRFRVEIKGSKITRRYIDIKASFGSYTGHRFELGKDISSFIKKSSTNDIATAVLGVGQSADGVGQTFSFADVVRSKANGDPFDKPAGQDWVGDEDARNIWGKRGRHIFYIHESQAETPERLLSESYEVLQNRNTPKVEMEIDGVLLERISGYENDRKRLGDTVIARVTGLNPMFTASVRITKMIISQTDPSRDKVTLSNYKELSSTLSASIVDQLQKIISEKQAAWDAAEANANSYTESYAEKKVHKGSTAPTDTLKLWLDTSVTPNIWKQYNGTSWVKATPSAASEVGAYSTTETDTKDQGVYDDATIYTEQYSEKKKVKGTTAPSDTDVIWIDINFDPHVAKVYDSTNAVWKKLTPTEASELKYSDGSTIENLKPAQAGADVTSQNTSADTSKVGGTTASTVRDQAANAVGKGVLYNGTTITETDGFKAVRSDDLVQVLMNATKGIVIQKRATTSDPWIDVLYIDTNGNVKFVGILEGATGNFDGDVIAKSLTINGGGTGEQSFFFKLANTDTGIDTGFAAFRSAYASAFGDESALEIGKKTSTTTGAVSNLVHLAMYALETYFSGQVTVEKDLVVRGKISNEARITVTSFLNGWVNYGSPYTEASYWKDKNGVVHITGKVKSGTLGSTIFILPTGYRPSGREDHGTFGSGGPAESARVDVLPTGEVIAVSGYGSGGWISLAGITFKAEN